MIRPRRLRLVVCAAAAVAATATGASAAFADTGNTPSTAQPVTVGTTYFGATSWSPDGSTELDEFWRLPPLLLGDHVQVAWQSEPSPDDSNLGQVLCMTGNVDDYSYNQDQCNFAEHSMDYDKGQRRVMTVPRASTDVFLEFMPNTGPGGYHFVVEKIQHKVGVAIPARSAVSRLGKIRVHPTLTDGSSLPAGGPAFELLARVGGRTLTRRATVNSNGVVAFTLKLPAAAVGKKASFQVTRAASTTYQKVSSPRVSITVKR